MSEPLSNNQTVNKASSELTAAPNFIRNLTDLQTFRLANTEMRKLTDGREIRPITEAEWVATAIAANKSDKLSDRQSGMSGWITVEEGFHIMRKLAEVTDYDLTGISSDELEAPATTLEEGELEYDDVVAKAFNRVEAPSWAYRKPHSNMSTSYGSANFTISHHSVCRCHPVHCSEERTEYVSQPEFLHRVLCDCTPVSSTSNEWLAIRNLWVA